MALAVQLYDEGSPFANPDQSGNRGEVRIYSCATTWLGNETSSPAAPGSPWRLAATGVYTVARFPAASPVVLGAPLALPAGAAGFLVELAPTNTVFHPPNQNVGAVHPLLHVAPAAERRDQFLRLSRQGSQGLAFQSTPLQTLGFNLGIDYQPDPNAAWSRAIGSGC
jgi:hypothetical protein